MNVLLQLVYSDVSTTLNSTILLDTAVMPQQVLPEECSAIRGLRIDRAVAPPMPVLWLPC